MPPAVDPLSNLHAVVPLRSLEGGKTRLGGALDAEERETLVSGLLRHTLDVLRAWPPLRGIHVVSGDPAVLSLAAARGASPVAEPSGADASPETLNAALRIGREAAVRAGATAVLLLPADLPLLDVDALDSLLDAADAALAAGSGHAVVVLAPADARDGTNALLLAPPEAVEPQFGPASLERHLRAAAAAGASVQVVVEPGVSFDLDTPDDVERLDARRLAELTALGAAVGAA